MLAPVDFSLMVVNGHGPNATSPRLDRHRIHLGTWTRLDPNLSSIGAVDPNLRAPQDRSGFHRTDERPAERIRVPQQEPGIQRANLGLRRTDQSPQSAKGPDRSGSHVTDPSMWDGSGPCRSNQCRGTDQGPVGQIRGAQVETGHRRTRTNRDPRDRPGPPGQTRVPRDETGPRKTNQDLQDKPGPCGDGSGHRGTNQVSIGLIRALLDYQDPA